MLEMKAEVLNKAEAKVEKAVANKAAENKAVMKMVKKS